jgi:hypothetical protein
VRLSSPILVTYRSLPVASSRKKIPHELSCSKPEQCHALSTVLGTLQPAARAGFSLVPRRLFYLSNTGAANDITGASKSISTAIISYGTHYCRPPFGKHANVGKSPVTVSAISVVPCLIRRVTARPGNFTNSYKKTSFPTAHFEPRPGIQNGLRIFTTRIRGL